jgi:hypothetical protein
MVTEQADPPRVEDARDVVPLLQEQPDRCIKDNSCRNLANAKVHCLTSRYRSPGPRLNEPTTGVHSFGGGSAALRAARIAALASLFSSVS